MEDKNSLMWSADIWGRHSKVPSIFMGLTGGIVRVKKRSEAMKIVWGEVLLRRGGTSTSSSLLELGLYRGLYGLGVSKRGVSSSFSLFGIDCFHGQSPHLQWCFEGQAVREG